MVATGALFVGVTALVKLMGDRVPAPQAAFLRYLFGLVMLAPMLINILRQPYGRALWAQFAGRGVVHALGVSLWFYAMARIPLAEVTAMNYLSPVYVTIGAALFLGERLALRRLAAVGVALVGAMIILRPGLRELSSGHLAMVFTALLFAASYLIAKQISKTVSPAVVVGMLSIFVAIGLAPMAIPVWVTPTSTELLILCAVAVLATAGHYTMTLAFRAAPLAITQPVTFLQLVWAVLLGALAFDESPDIWVIAGGVLIIAAISYIAVREAQISAAAQKKEGDEP